MHGPFKRDALTVNDFQQINGEKFENILKDFENLEDWGDDLPDFKKNVECLLKLIRKYTIEKDDVFV